jgi:hypothetical protein
VAKQFMQAMLILALPALVIVTGIAIVAYRRRNSGARD